MCSLRGATVSRGVPRVLPTKMYYPMPDTYLSKPPTPTPGKTQLPLGMLGKDSRRLPPEQSLSLWGYLLQSRVPIPHPQPGLHRCNTHR